nr:MAG TPA: hypothetical protein [Caudoviricetes sp.]
MTRWQRGVAEQFYPSLEGLFLPEICRKSRALKNVSTINMAFLPIKKAFLPAYTDKFRKGHFSGLRFFPCSRAWCPRENMGQKT